MRVEQIPILMDNYCYVLIDDATGDAAVVDPAEPSVVAPQVEAMGVHVTHILCTHHHWDHAGGNVEMKARFPGSVVVGAAEDAGRIPGLDVGVRHGDTVQVGWLMGVVLSVPCHTRSHLAYHFGDALFCGDTLFVGGCGRFFEGDAAQMHHALNEVFAALPEHTQVYCGHEYTVQNLRFAVHVEPDNERARAKLAWAEARQDRELSTVPSTLGEERSYNPFMRVVEPGMLARLGVTGPVEAMAILREMKNSYRSGGV